MDKKVTIADIAARIGVSKNSVSLALRGKDGVGDDLRRRIIDMAVELGYTDDAYLINARRDTCIAVILPQYVQGDIFFYSEVLWAIDNEIKTKGAHAVHLGVTKEMEQSGELPSMPKGLHVTGILIVGILAVEYVENLRSFDLPMLTVDIVYSGLPYVASSNFMGAMEATQKLIGLGHREIGFVGPIYAATSVYERWCGFILAMEEQDLPFKRPYNILGEKSFRLFDTEEVLEPYVNQMEKLPTAWFCAGDRIAIAMIHLLSKRGLRVPDDISIMGFDDILAAQMVLPCLTTIRTDRQLMGRLAVNYFYESRRNKDYTRVSTLVPFELVERDSVRQI